MSLPSLFSHFSPGEGVGSEALTHQQVSFSPFISCVSSQLPLFFLASLLSASHFSSHLFVCVPLSSSRALPSLCIYFLCHFDLSSPFIFCPPSLSLILHPCLLSFPCPSTLPPLQPFQARLLFTHLFIISPPSAVCSSYLLHSKYFSISDYSCLPLFSEEYILESGEEGGEKKKRRRRGGRKQGSLEPEGQLILIGLQPAY